MDAAQCIKTQRRQNIFCYFSTKNTLGDNQCLIVDKDKVEASEYVKILGVTLIIEKHITNICWSVNIHIRKINSIRRYLSDTAVRTLVQSIVIARLNYCNSVCIGLPMIIIIIIFVLSPISKRVQWTMHLGSSHMHVHAVRRVHAVTPKLVICVMYFNVNLKIAHQVIHVVPSFRHADAMIILQRLQLVQNSAVLVISQAKGYTSITPILDELHWLLINKRVSSKYCF